MSEIRVEAIHIHPVKSCRRIEVDEASVLSTGLAHDREWQIVDADGVCVTQRNQPSLATVGTALDGDDVILSASGCGSITLSAQDASSVTVLPLVGRRPVNCVDGGDEAEAGVHQETGGRRRPHAQTDGDSDVTAGAATSAPGAEDAVRAKLKDFARASAKAERHVSELQAASRTKLSQRLAERRRGRDSM